MHLHLEQLMVIQKIKLKKVRTKIGLDPVARLYLFQKNSQLYQKHNKSGLLSSLCCLNSQKIDIPRFNSLVADSAKLRYLDKELVKFKQQKRRVLIFCQMTKMMDILEEYLTRKKYRYFRLDG